MRPLALIALGAVAVPGAASAPSKPAGRIVFASARSSVGQAAGEQIYSLDVGSGRIRNLSRSGESDAAPAPSHRKNLIAFVRISRSTGKGALWVMRSDGSGQHPVADLQVFLHEQDQEIAWSTDGSMIAFSSFEPPDGARLWVVKPDGSGLRRLTDVFAASPSWSPDGAEVAFSGGVSADSARIGVVSLAGARVRWLTGPGPFLDTQPAWTPDGLQIGFVRTVNCEMFCGSSNLFVVGADGSGERQVTSFAPGRYFPIPLQAPAWSPNGRFLVYVRGGDGGHVELVRADGTGLRTLGKHAYAPASWSSSGKSVAFSQQRGTNLRLWRLTVRPLSGQARRYVLESPTSPVWAGPYWARGGKALVFTSSGTADFELFSAGPRGGGVLRLTRNRVDDFEPAWSPDGRRIAFARGKIKVEVDEGIQRSSLYVMTSDGRHVRRLTRGSFDTGPSWGPGGAKIVFSRRGRLYMLDPARATAHALGVAAGTDPAWSPDGGLIAFGVGPELDAIRPDGSGLRTLFDARRPGEVVLVSRPSWSADGRLLAFAVFVDRGNSFDESDVVITRTGQKRADLSCIPPAPPFEPEWSYEGLDRPALSPDGASLAVDGMAVCSVDGSGGYWLRAGDDPDWRR